MIKFFTFVFIFLLFNNITYSKDNYLKEGIKLFEQKKFDKAKFGKGAKKMFDINFLKDMKNSLETIAFLKYPRLKNMKLYLENSLNPVFVRMTGSGSALVAYFQTKKRCERAKKRFIQKYKNIWCIASKTI